MDDQERNYFWQQIRQLEQSNRRWKLTTFALVAVLAIFLILGGVSALRWRVVGMARMEMLREEMEAARAQLQAQQAAQQLQLMERQASQEKAKQDRKERGVKTEMILPP